MRVHSHQGDTVDAVVYRHLGGTAGLLEQVLETNPGLAAFGPILPDGTAVLLPDITAADHQPPARALVQLWE